MKHTQPASAELRSKLHRFGNRVSKRVGYTIERADDQGDKPASSSQYAEIFAKYQTFTMCRSQKYLLNLELAARFTPDAGTIVECGTWRGGMIAGIAEIVGREREFWLYVSFEGLPEATEIDGERALEYQSRQANDDPAANCRAEQAWAEKAMTKAGATNSTLVPGWFDATLPTYDGGPIALLRMDGDWYSSTMEILVHLYPHVVEGGLIIIDDYFAWDGCSRAVHDFLSEHKSADRIKTYDNVVAYIRKRAAA